MLGAGVCLLLATLVWLIATVAAAIDSTATTASVTGATDGGCTVTYTSPDGRQQRGEVDCLHERVGSSRTVWVLSNDPGDVVDGRFFLGGSLIVTAAGALFGAALVRIGRGRHQERGRHAARSVPLALIVRRRLSRPPRRRTD